MNLGKFQSFWILEENICLDLLLTLIACLGEFMFIDYLWFIIHVYGFSVLIESMFVDSSWMVMGSEWINKKCLLIPLYAI